MSSRSVVWERIQYRLNVGRAEWRSIIDNFGQVVAVETRRQGKRWSDAQIFEGLVRSILSSTTDWSKVYGVLPKLSPIFNGFEIGWYAALTCSQADQIESWFQGERASSLTRKKELRRLIATARKLTALVHSHGSLESYLDKMVSCHRGDPKALCLAIGGAQSSEKWPGLGIALAAEFLKNIGFDVSKPDRHINRAMGSFDWVTFGRWADRSGTAFPQATPNELLRVMATMEEWARELGTTVAFLDNTIWLACSKMGLHLSNQELAALATVAANRPAQDHGIVRVTVDGFSIRRIDRFSEDHISGLCDVLIDCVEGGDSIGFMWPMTQEKAVAFWRKAAASAARGERIVFVAEDSDGRIVGTAQLLLDQPENQPHRGDVAKMQVHRRARKRGIGAALLRACEQAALGAGKTVLVLDTASADAERLYERHGWQRCGVIPKYALMPDGRFCDTIVFYKLL